jgi:predicted  nucleic acid-binding Zn-ribbon protein
LEDQPQDEDAVGMQVQPDESRAAGHPSSVVSLLAELADLDKALRECETAWTGVVQRLEALRRELAVARLRVQRSHPSARKASRNHTEPEPRPTPRAGDETAPIRLMQGFELALGETEIRRAALHAAMDGIRDRKQALLERLPVAIARAYHVAADGGRVPAIASIESGTCGGCESPLPDSIIDALRHGAVAACARCERVLRPSKGGT